MAEEANVTGQGAGTTGVDPTTAQTEPRGQEKQPQEKTFTEKEFNSEVDRRVNEAIKNAQSKWKSDYDKQLAAEKDEAVRLAKMSADERAKAQREKEQKAFDEERAQFNTERLEFECAKQLSEKKLPINFSKILTGKDADTTKANIEAFEKEYNAAVQAAVEGKLKGTTPTTGGKGQETDSFLSGLGI